MNKTKRGSALLLATILLFVVLSMVVSLSYVTVMEQKMSQKTKSSVGSFFNADSGVEWALNKIANSSNSKIVPTFGAFNSDNSIPVPAGANYEVYLLGEDGKVITTNQDISTIKAVRSVGTQNTGEVTQRAIEAAVADTGPGGSYTVYGTTNCVASGYTDVYGGTGVAMLAVMTSPTGPVCKYGGDFPNAGSLGMNWVTSTNHYISGPGVPVPCAICVK